MKYSLLKEHENKFEMRHPDGSTFSVAKKGLSKAMQKKIREYGMHKMADGGMVEDQLMTTAPEPKKETLDTITTDAMKAPVNQEYQALLDRAKTYGGGLVPTDARAMSDFEELQRLRSAPPESLSNWESAKLRDLSQATQPLTMPAISPTGAKVPLSQEAMAIQPQAPARAPSMTEEKPKVEGVGFGITKQAQPTSETSPLSEYQKAFEMQKNAIQMTAKAEADAAAESVKALQKTQEMSQKFMDERLAQRKIIDARDAELRQQLADGKIKPNNLWANMGTGNKILAAFSIGLGGIGAGLTGGKNMAIEAFDRAVQDDIDAQKKNLDTKESLLKLNLQKLGDLDTATTATLSQLNQAGQVELAKIMAKSKSQQALANGQMLMADLKMKESELKERLAEKLAYKKVMASVGGATQGEGITAAQIAQMPEEQRKQFETKYVPGYGLGINPGAVQKINQELLPAKNEVESTIDRIMQLRREYGTEILNRDAVNEAQGLAKGLQGALRVMIAGPGAVSETERKLLTDLIEQDPLSMSRDKTIETKFRTLQSIVDKKFNAALQGAGVPTKPDFTSKERPAVIK